MCIESHELEVNNTIFGISNIDLKECGITYDKFTLQLSSHEEKLIDDVQIYDYINKKYLGERDLYLNSVSDTSLQVPFSIQSNDCSEGSIINYKLSCRLTAKTQYVVLDDKLYSFGRSYHYNSSTNKVAAYPTGSSKNIYVKKSKLSGNKAFYAYSSQSCAIEIAILKQIEREEADGLCSLFLLAKDNQLSKLEL